MRRAVLILLAVVLLLPAEAAQADLKSSLTRYMRLAGSQAGAYVVNLSTGEKVFAWRAGTPRILASNTKLFTSSAALARFGTEGTLGTEVLSDGRLEDEGVWRGNLYLRGGGDPTFGSSTYTRKFYGGGATVQQLAKLIDQAGVERVTGRVYGDETRQDSLRGGPDSGYGASIWVGPLSALSFNRGFANEGGSAFQTNPPAFAAARLDDALEARGIAVPGKPAATKAPSGLEVLASVDSPTMAHIIKLMNKPSDNFFAELLAKDIAMQVNGRGTTSAGASLIAGFARRLGSGAQLVDGSGLSRGNRASPYRVVRLLSAMYKRDQEVSDALVDSLPIAGRDGTLVDRMRRGAARDHCVGKTGTLSDVSALSGYCEDLKGDTWVYSILMNRVSPTGARVLQDKMLAKIAAQDL
ncbi:MAG: D-alanyl-D-alanine carboxypeptidase/D-alanyl-D-alanine-endopeptidase [Thermoleophilaceae bacterium]|nr:D-alanyl-D-alanine carboxypeptidase/D-alanyl-D-alanine-endopeptidase [Thermoleophilaceae bacterium]